MNNLQVFELIIVSSIFLGSIKFGSLSEGRKGWSWHLNFVEFWNDFINFFITGLVGYYFMYYRWPMLIKGNLLELSDFGLFIVFTIGIFGHLSVMSFNITKGIEAILKKILS